MSSINKLPTLALLAGGLATRLRPITESIPKSMIDINGKPFIDHQLRLLQKKGVESVVICAGYLSEQIMDYVKDGKNFGLEVKYSNDGKDLLGTGGSLKKAINLLDDDFLVMYGDSYLDIDLLEIWKSYKSRNSLGLMTVIKNDNQWDKSNILFQDNKIMAYEKKNPLPEMNYIDYGCSIFNKTKFLELTNNKEKFDLADIHHDLIIANALDGFEVFSRFYEIGSYSGISELQQLLKNND